MKGEDGKAVVLSLPHSDFPVTSLCDERPQRCWVGKTF